MKMLVFWKVDELSTWTQTWEGLSDLNFSTKFLFTEVHLYPRVWKSTEEKETLVRRANVKNTFTSESPRFE